MHGTPRSTHLPLRQRDGTRDGNVEALCHACHGQVERVVCMTHELFTCATRLRMRLHSRLATGTHSCATTHTRTSFPKTTANGFDSDGVHSEPSPPPHSVGTRSWRGIAES